MSDSLRGLRVIDFTQVAAGPTCTMMLADRGADVIKIEAPAGDLGRRLGPAWKGGDSIVFLSLNRNKRSVVLDLKQPEDLLAARQLVQTADVVTESFRPGVMAKLGLGYESLRELKPHLIFCSISAYGQRAADRAKPGVDGIVQAVSGLMSVTGFPGAPSKVQAPVVDMVTGFLATLAILDALRCRDRTGEGAWLDVSMYGSSLQLQQTALATYLATGEIPVPCGSGAPYAAPNEAYPTRDGWIMVAAYHEQRWRALCAVLGLETLADDDRFKTCDLRVDNRGALYELLAAKLKTRTTADWTDRLEAADILCGPVADYRDVTASAQFASLAPTVRFDHATAGETQVIGPLDARGSRSARPVSPPPLLGQHTAQVLGELRARSPSRSTDLHFSGAA